MKQNGYSDLNRDGVIFARNKLGIKVPTLKKSI